MVALKLYSKPRKRRASPEAQLQIAVVEYLRLAGVPGLLYFSCPNEQKCSVQRGVMLKKMGRLAGVSDLVVVIPNAERPTCSPTVLFLELKADGEKQTQNQVLFARAAVGAGCAYACVDNINDAIPLLQNYGAIKNVLRRREAAQTKERCNCDASCGENRYHDFGSAECMYRKRSEAA